MGYNEVLTTIWKGTIMFEMIIGGIALIGIVVICSAIAEACGKYLEEENVFDVQLIDFSK